MLTAVRKILPNSALLRLHCLKHACIWAKQKSEVEEDEKVVIMGSQTLFKQ